jgi:hypothetical protein
VTRKVKIALHDYSLRGHVQRQCLFTPMLGVKAIKGAKWNSKYELMRKRFNAWVYAVREAWPQTSTVRNMQLCVFPATALSGRGVRTCKRIRQCPWCWARHAVSIFDLLKTTPVPSGHIVITFSHRRRLYATETQLMTSTQKTQAVGVLATWIGDFKGSTFQKTNPFYGGAIDHALFCTDYEVVARRFGVCIIPADQIDAWRAWQNGPRKFQTEKRHIRVFDDVSEKTLAKAVVAAFKFPRRLFYTSTINLAHALALKKNYRFFRTVGACYASNPGLKKDGDNV